MIDSIFRVSPVQKSCRAGKPIACSIINIVRLDSVVFFTELVVRPRHESYRPPVLCTLLRLFQNRLLHLEILPLRQLARADNVDPSTTYATRISLGSTAILDLSLPPVARLPADTEYLQTRYLSAVAPLGLSTLLDLEIPLPPRRAATYSTGGARTY